MTEAQLLESLVAELRKRAAGPEDARTVTEWGPLFGLVNEKSIRTRIRALIASGHMERTRIIREDLGGVDRTVNGYRLTGAP